MIWHFYELLQKRSEPRQSKAQRVWSTTLNRAAGSLGLCEYFTISPTLLAGPSRTYTYMSFSFPTLSPSLFSQLLKCIICARDNFRPHSHTIHSATPKSWLWIWTVPRSESLFFLLYVQHICTYSRQRLWWWVWHQELAAPNPPSRNSANNCANYCTSQRLDVTYAWVAVAVVFEAPPQLSLSNPKAATTPHFHSPITHAHTRTHAGPSEFTLHYISLI